MPSYDDDDFYDETEAHDFQDEAEFDDYLNDEEYELINTLFPKLKKVLTDENYVGWNNLDVKLALFDNDFDLHAATVELKKRFKRQKKKEPVPRVTTVNPVPEKRSATLKLKNLSIKDKEKSGTKSAPNDDDDDDAWLLSDDDFENGGAGSSKKIENKLITAVKPYVRVTTPKKPRHPVQLDHYLSQAKPHLSFVVLGHVDAGKSTLMGRLLYDIGAVQTSQIRKLKKESESIGKGSFHLAWVMDQTSEERERGVTVSICTSSFETETAKFTIVDAPGHRDFVPNAIAGVSQADIALLTIDCGTNAFENGFTLDGQTKEHALLAKFMDVDSIVVVMNKLDSVDWSESRYDEIKARLEPFLTEIGFASECIYWIPCSGFSGAGVYKIPYPAQQDWYTGPNLMQTLENIAAKRGIPRAESMVCSPFLFSILEVLSAKKNDEAIVSGRVEAGSIQPGELITIYPSEQSVLVDKISSGKQQESQPIAIEGDFVTLKLRQAFPEDIRCGDLAASVDLELPMRQTFILQLRTFNMNRPLLPGTTLMLFRGVTEKPARISKLICTVDKNNPTKVLKKKVRHLPSNQAAIVEVELLDKKSWVPTMPYEKHRRLGRVILRKDGRTIAAGRVLKGWEEKM